MTDSSPGLLLEAMQHVEKELEDRMNAWASAEEDLVRRRAQMERLAAPRRFKLKKEDPNRGTRDKLTVEDLDAKILDWLWTEHGELMEALIDAEALCAAYQTIYKVAAKTLSSKQSRLKADLKLQDGPAE